MVLVQVKEKFEQKNILFVCEDGATKSAITSAFFNRLAKEKGLNYVSIFKGINPYSAISLATPNGLVKDGFEISNWTPQLLSKADLKEAHRIVTLGYGLPPQDSAFSAK